ncbi:cell division protein [Granulicella cerasi]|uniref:Cell division protein n=1 Tax=Granulicella cerasi TaxID=741063 RepID=A0ABW1Z9B0_9BACT|nr:SRPBCC family protein [Granulicella cerasi]
MQTVTLTTKIAAPIERCFLLSLSIDLHQQSASATGERAIAGVTHGIIGANETVKWRGKHFGLWLTHTTIISGYESPRWFQDSMMHGLFKSFVHDHYIEPQRDGSTLMRDELSFAAPLGLLGTLVEKIELREHMRSFLIERNDVIRRVAESGDEWQQYLPPAL